MSPSCLGGGDKKEGREDEQLVGIREILAPLWLLDFFWLF